MNKDFRVSVAMPSHTKTIKLMRRLGDRAFYNLIKLWAYTATNKPSGTLTGMDSEDIEIAADWVGDIGVFTETLINLRFLDQDKSGCLSIHAWDEHNEYAIGAEQRSEKARKAANARYDKEKASSNGAKPAETINDEPAKTCSEQCSTDDLAMPFSSLLLSSSLSSLQKNTTCTEPEKTPGSVLLDSESGKQQTISIDCQQKEQSDSTPSPTQEVQQPVVSIPLVCKKDGPLVEFGVTQALVDDWAESYPGVDVLQTLKEIRQWNLSNPTRRKTKTGIKTHITNWLAKEQNKGGATRQMGHGTTSGLRVIPGMPARTVNNINAAQAFLERQQHEQAG